jgi:hypothetical protein
LFQAGEVAAACFEAAQSTRGSDEPFGFGDLSPLGPFNGAPRRATSASHIPQKSWGSDDSRLSDHTGNVYDDDTSDSSVQLPSRGSSMSMDAGMQPPRLRAYTSNATSVSLQSSPTMPTRSQTGSRRNVYEGVDLPEPPPRTSTMSQGGARMSAYRPDDSLPSPPPRPSLSAGSSTNVTPRGSRIMSMNAMSLSLRALPAIPTAPSSGFKMPEFFFQNTSRQVRLLYVANGYRAEKHISSVLLIGACSQLVSSPSLLLFLSISALGLIACNTFLEL